MLFTDGKDTGRYSEKCVTFLRNFGDSLQNLIYQKELNKMAQLLNSAEYNLLS